MKRTFVGLAVVAGVTAGCETSPSTSTPNTTPPLISTPTEGTPQSGGAYLSATDKHTISSAFETGKAYIESRHVGSTATLQLVTLEGNAQAACEQTPYTSTGPGPEYCNSTSALLFDAQFASKDMPAMLSTARIAANAVPNYTASALKYVVSHELGHHLQTLEDPTSFMQPQLQKEEQADCLAGQILHATDPAVISEAATFIEHMPGDPAHGTPQEREAKFMLGANDGDCITP